MVKLDEVRVGVQPFDRFEKVIPAESMRRAMATASRFRDYQARRLKLRYRDENGKVRHCHTLNNTVVATPRVLIALLEVHQQADGSIRVPEIRGKADGREIEVAFLRVPSPLEDPGPPVFLLAGGPGSLRRARRASRRPPRRPRPAPRPAPRGPAPAR